MFIVPTGLCKFCKRRKAGWTTERFKDGEFPIAICTSCAHHRRTDRNLDRRIRRKARAELNRFNAKRRLQESPCAFGFRIFSALHGASPELLTQRIGKEDRNGECGGLAHVLCAGLFKLFIR